MFEDLRFITIKDVPELIEKIAFWFSSKWSIPKEVYLKCMNDYLTNKTKLGWFVCLNKERIVAGLGVIENDFHERKDLTPNICAVYVEEEYRNQGIAGKLLNNAVADLRKNGIAPVYVVTDHIGFYERYGFKFLTTTKCEDGTVSRIYVR